MAEGGLLTAGRAGGVSLPARCLRVLVRAYQLVPRPGPGRCRFEPTCSTYAYQALTEHGALRGGWLAVRRITRCHPFNPGGIDRVPPVTRATPDL